MDKGSSTQISSKRYRRGVGDRKGVRSAENMRGRSTYWGAQTERGETSVKQRKVEEIKWGLSDITLRRKIC